ncbi:MAG: DUF2330 domain-containing protein [Bacillota bacterium]|jgi:hypothetical protein|nr:DUF2330 domain-containing protein [Thermoanaerobacteraceae bacterium]
MTRLFLPKIILGLTALVVLSLCVSLPAAQADRGIIVPDPVRVEEPGQTAFIAFNGREEILLLGTDVKAARATAALQFTPFPSPPEAALAPEDAFARLQELLTAHHVFYWKKAKGAGSPEATLGEGEPVKVLSHQKLGLHDVTVVEVRDAARFAAWVQNYFRKQGWPVRALTAEEEAVVAGYCRRGLKYFVIDRVELKETLRSVPPLTFRFATPALYYPLKVTNLFGGEGEAQLVVCGEEHLFARLPAFLATTVPSGRWEESTRAAVAPRELARVAPGAAKLFAGEQELQAFRYRGKLSFRGDLWVDPAAPLLRVGGQACPEAVLHQEKGAWLVPARDVFAGLNAKVSWDAKRREVVAAASGLHSRVPKNSAANSVWEAIGATFESWAEEYLGKPVGHMIVNSPLEIRFPVDPRPVPVYDPAAKKTRTRPCYLAYVNGRRYVLYDPAAPGNRVAPRVVNGRFYLPAGVFADLLGAEVTWDNATGELRIDRLRFWQKA